MRDPACGDHEDQQKSSTVDPGKQSIVGIMFVHNSAFFKVFIDQNSQNHTVPFSVSS